MKKAIYLMAVLLSGFTTVQAQFTLSGQYRPRAEYRHGFKQLPEAGANAAFFIDQRTRINMGFISDKYDVKIVLQDVRVWGSQSQLVVSDGATTTIHEAWGLLKFNEKVGLKLGRQEIIYDDSRIFGNVGWAQQARSHDAAILQITPLDTKIHIGLAYNQDGARLYNNFYSVTPSYKTFQYVWAQKQFEFVKASILLLNLGNQGGDQNVNDGKTYFQQTIGGRLAYKKNNLAANIAVYGQFGDMPLSGASISVSALLYSVDVSYALVEDHRVVVGYEHLSGNDAGAASENNAFNPYFGTNHKFNGLMDYFYVGNHNGSVGLNDIQFGVKSSLTDKLSTGVMAHIFSADGEIPGMSKSLGTEIDLTGKYKVSSEVGLAFGYSQMFGTETLEALRTGDKDETANWAWVMLTFNPTFFTTKENQE